MNIFKFCHYAHNLMSFQNGMTGKLLCPFILHYDKDWLVTIKARCMYTVCVAYIWSAV